MAVEDLVAEAVRTAFAGGYSADPRTVSQDIDVSRVHVPQVDALPKLVDFDAAQPAAKAIKVYVFALPEKKNYGTRGKRDVIYSVQVAIAAKAKNSSLQHVDPLKTLAAELRDWFFQKGARLPGREEAIDDIENLVSVDVDALKGKSLFLSEFVLKFSGSTV